MVALFTISNLLHFTLGVWIINHHARFRNLLRNPMVIATILGFGFALWRSADTQWLAVAIKMVGDALIPMMLLSLGVRLFEVRWDDWQLGLIGGIVCPLTGMAVATLFSSVVEMDRMQHGLLLLFGCLPPAVLNFMVAEQFRQEPPTVASIVLIGNLLSIVFVLSGSASHCAVDAPARPDHRSRHDGSTALNPRRRSARIIAKSPATAKDRRRD